MSKSFFLFKKFSKGAFNLALVNYAIPPVCALFMLKADLLSADQGDTIEQCQSGSYSLHDKEVLKDYQKAVHYYTLAVQYYKLAADQGYAQAQFKLGFFYHHGEGVPQNYKKAVHYYTLAADQGHVKAQFTLGLCHEYGKGVPKDHEKAVDYYTLAANQGYLRATEALERLQ
ncbi:MAG: tetratricopeptide repeat protein [Simkaniaceae bacterium]|nr:tetratricopeptide repeat protein [Simkaniaceae bacterium]